uniref:Uncharacterized protein n=1 Tax=mine drainage metagenome TaxID=410659 RepID=E6QSX8_9ZZZZ
MTQIGIFPAHLMYQFLKLYGFDSLLNAFSFLLRP